MHGARAVFHTKTYMCIVGYSNVAQRRRGLNVLYSRPSVTVPARNMLLVKLKGAYYK